MEKRNAVKWNGRDSCKIFNNGTEKIKNVTKKHTHTIIADVQLTSVQSKNERVLSVV